jgi:hypothetical protein
MSYNGETLMRDTEVNREGFTLLLPDSEWKDHSSREYDEFRLGETEQVIVKTHLMKKVLSHPELQAAVIELFRAQLSAAKQLSGDTCTFESPVLNESEGRFDAFVVGRDVKNGVCMQFGFFGRDKKIVVVSYYDHSRTGSLDEFKKRANGICSTLKLT